MKIKLRLSCFIYGLFFCLLTACQGLQELFNDDAHDSSLQRMGNRDYYSRQKNSNAENQTYPNPTSQTVNATSSLPQGDNVSPTSQIHQAPSSKATGQAPLVPNSAPTVDE